MSVQKYRLSIGFGWKVIIQLPGRDPKGKRRQLTKRFEKKADAISWEREQRYLLKVEEIASPCSKPITLRELSEYWLKNYGEVHKEASSLYGDRVMLRCQILNNLGDENIHKLSVEQVDIWKRRLIDDKGLAPKTVNNCLGLLKKIMKDAVRWGFINRNVVGFVQPLKIPQQEFQFLTREECSQLLTYLKFHESWAYPVIASTLYTGLRRGEASGLLWDCVDFNLRQITVKRIFCFRDLELKMRTKNKKIRRIPINDALFEILMVLRRSTAGSVQMGIKVENAVFTGFDFNHTQRTTSALCKKAGVTQISFHDLRHTFASNFMMAGGNVYDLKELLGHSTVQMTERYSHLSPGHMAGKTNVLNFSVPGDEDTKKIVNLNRNSHR